MDKPCKPENVAALVAALTPMQDSWVFTAEHRTRKAEAESRVFAPAAHRAAWAASAAAAENIPAGPLQDYYAAMADWHLGRSI